MTRCAVVDQNNIVVNIIMADPNVDSAPNGTRFIVTETAGPGWVWNGSEFIDPTPPPEPRPPSVPASITRRQCALQLLAMQIITAEEALAMTKAADVPTAIAVIFGQMPAEQRVLAEIDFAATNYYRDNPLLGLMGLTEDQIDQFFIEAAKL